MSAVRLAVMGAGSVRCSPAVIGTLATYFGERPLVVVLYDSDPDRLDLFDRFARFCFFATHATHQVEMTDDPEAALAGASKVILQIEENCANRMLNRSDGRTVEDAVAKICTLIPWDCDAMSLMLNREIPLDEYRAMDWPGPISNEDHLAIPYQILRYLNQEDYLYDILKAGRESPLRPWLDLPVRR